MIRSRRIGIVHASLALLMLAVLGKAAHVQLVQGSAWADLARRQHFTDKDVPAPRGLILDASGRTLAMSRDLVRLELAPAEVREPRKLRSALLAVGVPHATAARVMDKNRPWLVIPGLFVARDVAAIIAMRGVYPTAVSERAYAATPALRALLGSVDAASRGIDGLEMAMDSLLAGTAGASHLVRDFRSRGLASPTQPGEAARPGHTVKLTINHELQDIAERTLADAVARMGAQGGDIVILDPRDGSVLAIAGQRNGKSVSVTALTEPFEPGSTLKPLIVSGLLARGKARLTDQVPARDGSYKLHGRTVNDEPHAEPMPPMLSLADVIRLSSNVGIVQFAERFEPREQFETLRDFGLGTPTGIPYSSEAAGTLRPPAAWSRQSSASLSLGYEIAVTPMQLALAYAAIANGGELLEPSLVREIRAPDGKVVFSHERRVVRRVISRRIAATVRDLLGGVVERGTAVDADLASYAMAGKTGTPRRAIDGRYAPMQYNPNFVGLFPAEAPQLVVVVKLGSPKGNFYGGHTAAPMTKTIVQAALAARDAALDRSALSPKPSREDVSLGRQAGALRAPVSDDEHARADANEPEAGVTLDLPATAPRVRVAQSARVVPGVRGLSVREAVQSLHSAGFRVQLVRGAASSSRNLTEPAQGMTAMSGSVVRLHVGR